MKLSELKHSEKAVIIKIDGNEEFRRRITEMGFVRGKVVTVVKKAPLRDPIEYNVMGYEISLRQSESRLVEILSPSEALDSDQVKSVFEGTIFFDSKTIPVITVKKMDVIVIVL